jgi:hypothetical protein
MIGGDPVKTCISFMEEIEIENEMTDDSQRIESDDAMQLCVDSFRNGVKELFG